MQTPITAARPLRGRRLCGEIPGTAVVVLAMLGTCSCRPGTSQTSPTIANYPVGARPRAIATADLDGDGLLDAAVANSGDGTVTILLGSGGGRLRPAPGSPIPAGNEPSDVDAVDLDQDGDQDLVLANHETSGITVLLNDGGARFTAAPGSPFDTGARPHARTSIGSRGGTHSRREHLARRGCWVPPRSRLPVRGQGSHRSRRRGSRWRWSRRTPRRVRYRRPRGRGEAAPRALAPRRAGSEGRRLA